MRFLKNRLNPFEFMDNEEKYYERRPYHHKNRHFLKRIRHKILRYNCMGDYNF